MRQVQPTVVPRSAHIQLIQWLRAAWIARRRLFPFPFVGAILLLSGCGVALTPIATTIPTPAIASATPRLTPRAGPKLADPAPSSTPVLRVEKRPTLQLTATHTATPTVTVEPTARSTVTPIASVTLTPGPTALIVHRGVTTEKVVALTYDAGADRGQAANLLAYLQEAGVSVTFGMTGRWAESNPDLVRRIVADGHELMNHTYDHRSFTGVSASPPVLRLQDRIDEIEHTETIIHAISGATSKPLFRPPYGDEDASVLQAVAAAGYRYSVMWTVDTLGWRGASVSEIVDRCLRGAQSGAIYVLHVGAGSHDIEATRPVVEGLRARGYRFETVGQLIAESGR